MVRLQVSGIFKVRTYADACDIAHGGCTDTEKESALEVDSGRKNPLQYRLGLEPASVLRLVFQSDALPTELSRPLISYSALAPR